MRKLKWVVIAIFAFLLIGLFYYLEGTYSDGYRAGTMVKFSNKGFLFKTYEGELNLGMVFNDDPGKTPTSMGTIWAFSVKKSEKEVISKIDSALLSGKRIKLHYHEKYTTGFWRGDTKYLIDEAEIVK